MTSTVNLSRLLIVVERDVGLFSTVQQVLNTLLLFENHNINRQPIVILGQSILYFHVDGHRNQKTVWEYYFKPLVSHASEKAFLAQLGDQALDLIESKRKQLERVRGAIEFPQDIHLLPPLTPQDDLNLARLEKLSAELDWAWTESFYPIIDGERLDPSEISDKSLAPLLKRYVQPRPYIERIVDELFEKRLRGFYVIGVHVRGTDGHSAPGRGVDIPFDQYFAEIEKKFGSEGKSSCRVYLATDEQYIVSLFEQRYGKSLVYYESVRKVDDDEIFGVGPTGQVMPAYIANNPGAAVKNGEDAVIEYALLCRSEVLIHNVSSISFTARLQVPSSTLIQGSASH